MEAKCNQQERYPPVGGHSVTAFAVESLGRFGLSAEELLSTLVAEATRHARRRGYVAIASTFLRKWRASLDATLQRGVAASLLAGQCGLSGKPHNRWR